MDGLHHTQNAQVHCPSSQEDPEFPLDENRHSHHAHLAFYRGSPIASEERETLSLSSGSLPAKNGSLSLSLPPSLRLSTYLAAHVSVHPFLFARVYVCTPSGRVCARVHTRVALLAHAPVVSLPSVHTPQRPTLLFCAAALLPRRSRSLIRFRFQPEGPGEASVESDG